MSTTLGQPCFVWLGAGEAIDTQLLNQFLVQFPDGLVALVEARESAVVKLQQRYAASINYSVNSAVIGIQKEKSTFHTLSLPEFSSLQQPTGLVSLFPGVAVQKIDLVDTLAIDQYIAGLNIETQQPNHLYIDIPAQVGGIVRQLLENEQLHFFSEIHITASIESLYEKDEKLSDIEGFLAKQGYELVSTDSTDPDILLTSFKLNPLWASLCITKIALAKATQDHTQLSKQFELVSDQLSKKSIEVNEAGELIDDKDNQVSKQIEEVEALKVQLSAKATQIAEQQTQLITVNKKSADKSLELAKQAELLEGLRNQLDAKTLKTDEQSELVGELKKQLQETTDALSLAKDKLGADDSVRLLGEGLEQKLHKMFEAQTHDLNATVSNIKGHITAGLGNTAKQLESFYGIQNYIERGVKPLSFHGWPISPDIGLYITGLIDTNNYDVIIEFGSGTSTVLMAKALLAKQRNMPAQRVVAESQLNQKPLVAEDRDQSDIPVNIITFEHNSSYYEKTHQALVSNNINDLVDLVHAPLVDYKYKDGTEYLYYNCSEKLTGLATMLKDRKAKILVLVDGPPGATNHNARFPALPHLLDILPGNEFTIIMDDYYREEEKEILKLWQDISIERGMSCQFESILSEKGMAVLSVK